MVYFKENKKNIFFKVSEGVQHFPGGGCPTLSRGGVQLFPGGGGV